uniref:Uncharacterized protein n=1 Tax=Noccaea caerulescens TaxID=107243 RepID=A0A1J3IY85_NOCCA
MKNSPKIFGFLLSSFFTSWTGVVKFWAASSFPMLCYVVTLAEREENHTLTDPLYERLGYKRCYVAVWYCRDGGFVLNICQ